MFFLNKNMQATRLKNRLPYLFYLLFGLVLFLHNQMIHIYARYDSVQLFT